MIDIEQIARVLLTVTVATAISIGVFLSGAVYATRSVPAAHIAEQQAQDALSGCQSQVFIAQAIINRANDTFQLMGAPDPVVRVRSGP